MVGGTVIRLRAEALEAIRAHAREGYPEEACGALLGPPGRDGERRIARPTRLPNAREHERRRRYLIAPDALRTLEADASRAGLEIVGFYHSHPDHPGEPSRFDLEQAWPWYTYLIVPVVAHEPGVARAWRLRDDRSGFDEEELLIESGRSTA
jgi:proteasome lid subunit RPN8/RPN11